MWIIISTSTVSTGGLSWEWQVSKTESNITKAPKMCVFEDRIVQIIHFVQILSLGKTTLKKKKITYINC